LETQTEYRVGSPFAEEPGDGPSDNADGASGGEGNLLAEPKEILAAGSIGAETSIEPETLGDGVWGQTAESAVFASIMLSGFAAACWLFFPPGGVAVASLGVAVSLLALGSTRTRLTGVFLAVHGVLFILCYLKTI
jgi:hypothetical protein